MSAFLVMGPAVMAAAPATWVLLSFKLTCLKQFGGPCASCRFISRPPYLNYPRHNGGEYVSVKLYNSSMGYCKVRKTYF